MVYFTYSQTTKQTACIAFGLIATHFTKIAFQLLGTHAIFFCKVFLGVNRFPFVHHVPQVFVPHQHGIKHCLFIKLKLILLKHSHALAGRYFNGSLIWFYLTTEYFQESTFACAIGTDHTITISLNEIDVNFFKQYPFTIRKGYIFALIIYLLIFSSRKSKAYRRDKGNYQKQRISGTSSVFALTGLQCYYQLRCVTHLYLRFYTGRYRKSVDLNGQRYQFGNLNSFASLFQLSTTSDDCNPFNFETGTLTETVSDSFAGKEK